MVTIASSSCSSTASVISSSSRFGASRAAASACVTIVTSPRLRNCTGERFTATLIGSGQRDADADAGNDLLAVDLERLADHLDHPARQQAGRIRARVRLQNRKLVAAEARDRVALADRAADALGDRAEQPVSDWMTERVVDALEIVEVEAEHRERLAAGIDAREALGHALAEQHAVRQVGQRV